MEPTEPTPPVEPTPEPPAPVASGMYQVRSNIDVTANAVLPSTAYEVVTTLRSFSEQPARTLFDLAEDAGVPAVGTIRDALPSALESRLEGWIDDEIAKLSVNGVPVTQLAANIAALGETSLSSFAIDSTLTVQGSTATHRLTTLDLTPTGLDAKFALDALPANVIERTATCASDDGTFSIGDHRFSIEYGAYVWQALDQHVTAEYGASIRATLGAAVNCPAIAARVADQCLWGACVGHETELTSICERGLDEVVARVHDKITAMRFDALRLAAGTATITDTRLDGTWTAELDVGQGLRPVPAAFTAVK